MHDLECPLGCPCTVEWRYRGEKRPPYYYCRICGNEFTNLVPDLMTEKDWDSIGAYIKKGEE